MSEITVTAADGGTFKAYVASPGAAKAPAIVVIQEIFGVNDVMRRTCDALAADGYLAICPDLFWRIEPGIEISDKSEAEWKRAFELFNAFDQEKGVADLKATLVAARAHQGSTGKVGTVGYCLGGRLAYMMAARTDVDCAVSYYGVGLEGLLGEASAIKAPILLHVAELDKFVPPEAQAKIKDGLAGHPKAELHTYPGVDHAFARIDGVTYEKSAAETANKRTAAFFARHLKGS